MSFFFLMDTTTTKLYTLSLHDALPICRAVRDPHLGAVQHPAVARLFRDGDHPGGIRSEEHTSELQSRQYIVCRLLLEKKKLFQMMGERIRDDYGILATEAKERLPIFCPALADSSIGMALTVYRNEKLKKSAPPAVYDALMDNIEIMDLKRQFPKSGVIFIGGGTPKNYIQQVVPMAEISGWAVPPHSYAIQVTTDDPKFGGLSGCELPESQSWGKLDPNAEQCTVHLDATIGLPLLFTGIMEHYEEWKSRGPLKVNL